MGQGPVPEAPQLIGTLEPEYEKVAALKPDLILDTKSSGDQDRYDTLKGIAPTVGVPTGGEVVQGLVGAADRDGGRGAREG